MMKIICFLLLLIHVVDAKASDELSSELNEFMVLQPISDQYFENNAYIGWMGLTYPREDWLIAYRDIFKINDETLNQRAHDGRLITNYFANPTQSIFQFSANKTILNDLFGYDAKLIELKDDLGGQKLLSFKQESLDNKRYLYTKDFFACAEYLDNLCLTKMLSRSTYIQKTIKRNQQLLDRFQVLVETSQYNYALFHNDFNASADTVPSSGMIKLIQLYLTDAIMKITQGDVDEGLNQLVLVRQWIDLIFHEKSKAALLHFFVNISVTQFLDQSMNALLDSGFLDTMMNDARLQWIVRPYAPTIGKKLNEVVLFEMKQDFKDVAYPYIRIYTSPAHQFTFTEEDEFIILSFLKDFGVILSPALEEIYTKRSQTAKEQSWSKLISLKRSTQSVDKTWLNTAPATYNTQSRSLDRRRGLDILQSRQERFLQVLTDWYQDYFQTLGISPKEALLSLNEIYPSIEFYNDYFNLLQILSSDKYLQQHLSPTFLEETLKDKVMPKTLEFAQKLSAYSDFNHYWMRLYEQQNYHQMVYLKYLVMKDKIPTKDIPMFLQNKGDIARHTISKNPYLYDPNTGKLSTPLPKNNKYLPVHIKTLRLYDSSIKNFEVIFPKY
ncbi:hypothetical protein [Wohlfahrtiimonas larvae]|uniref:Uncharacterized protein n=1 Tax=Wohlfahrtiimonas larvae TaxID=1157986 RepID=A0ABP9MVX0_9GAMM|nr:hypothetical protein [Wohlfahrtiimonas larvae]